MKKLLIFIVFISILMLAGCNNKARDAENFGLVSVTDAADLAKLLKKGIVRYNFKNSERNEEFDAAAPESPSSEYQSSDYTKTNVQVEGVDEGDIMKTDGSRIYSISWDRLQVIKLTGNGDMELLLNEKLTTEVSENNYHNYTYYSELYVTADYLIVIGQKYSYNYVYLDSKQNYEEDVATILPYYYSYTTMSIVEIYDKESLEKVDNYEVSGHLLGSRLINNQLYLISSHYIYNYEKNYDFDVRPWYKHNNETSYFDYKDIKYIPNTISDSFTVISNVNLEQDEIAINSDVFLSANSWGQIYVSTSAIYFASNYSVENFFGRYVEKGILVSFQFNEETGEVFFGGYGTYQGYLINQFAIDEYDGYIRIATTEGWGNDVKNRLYIFKRIFENDIYKLERISLIDSGLGKPGERIQSVRFNKEIATIVTFLRTDPFYTVDLSDPYHPVIAGELEIPGFSTYQHPWTEDLVIGIGFDADDGVVTGMKLSLYDISDITNPKEIGKPLVFENGQSGWSFSEATYNHKAVMIDKTRNCFGFSMWRYRWRVSEETMNDYLVFDVDETRDQPIQIKHKISHDDYMTEYADLYTYYWHYDFQIKRAFRVDDYLYVISGEVITSHNLLGDLSTVDEIIFQEFYVT
jgi:uncharacterized secreted protein with C-terminal beta-propeller domain